MTFSGKLKKKQEKNFYLHFLLYKRCVNHFHQNNKIIINVTKKKKIFQKISMEITEGTSTSTDT